MLQINEEIRLNYRKCVDSVFSGIVKRLDGELIEIEKDIFCFTVGKFRYFVCLSWGHLPSINLIIMPSNLAYSELEKYGIGISNFVKFREGNSVNIDLRVKMASEVQIKMQNIANYFIRYCDDLLENKISYWENVNKFVRQKIEGHT